MATFDEFKLEFQEIADPKVLDMLGKIGEALALIYKKEPVFPPQPKASQLEGKIEVTKQPPVTVTNLGELEKYFRSLEQKLVALAQAASTAPAQKIELPKIEFPKMEKAVTDPKLMRVLESLSEKIDEMNAKDIKMPRTISVDNFPIQMTPQPVTNIWLNPAQGFTKTTDNTVGVTASPLPGYGRLFNRRSMLIYNNSGNTIYIGGSDVTVANGLPIPPSSYGPSIDAGYDMVIYGVSAQNGNDVRVLEVSKDQTANVQE